jgi:16S rRNA (cytidine1402-2'-O)-methyltransferase
MIDRAMSAANPPGTLYVVATPIGNLSDLSMRARETLAAVDLVLAEDTRVTRTLLAHWGLHPITRALHDHNEGQIAPAIIEQLGQGESMAIVADAGTPGVSDPGARLVRMALDAGIRVTPIPGPNAAIAALSASGFTGPFWFVGFAPEKETARRKALTALKGQPCTLVFYEAPHRLAAMIADLIAVLGGERRIVIARELTKMFEEIKAMPLAAVPAWLATDPNHARGEFVLLVEGATAHEQGAGDEDDRILHPLLETLPLSQAVALAVRMTGRSRNTLYERALAWRRARGKQGNDGTEER